MTARGINGAISESERPRKARSLNDCEQPLGLPVN